MRKQCHCNGTRGTDCDWCQGSGWVTDPIKISHLNDLSKSTTNNQTNPVNNIKKKVFLVIEGKAVEQNAFNLQIENSLSEIRRRIKTTSRDIKELDINSQSSDTIYITKKLEKLNADIVKFDKKFLKKTHKKQIIDTQRDIKNLYVFLEQKQKSLTEPKYYKTSDIDNVKKNSETNTNKSKITFADKFKDIFKSITKKLK